MNARATLAIGARLLAFASIALIASALAAACGGSSADGFGHSSGGSSGISGTAPAGAGGTSGDDAIEDWCARLCGGVAVCPDPAISTEACVDECVSWGSPFECSSLRLNLELCARAMFGECKDLSGCDHVLEEINNCMARPDECAPDHGGGFGLPGVQVMHARVACACAGTGGRAPGEACASAEVCGAACCACSEPGAEITVHACLAGRCAEPEVACDIALTNEPHACE